MSNFSFRNFILVRVMTLVQKHCVEGGNAPIMGQQSITGKIVHTHIHRKGQYRVAKQYRKPENLGETHMNILYKAATLPAEARCCSQYS